MELLTAGFTNELGNITPERVKRLLLDFYSKQDNMNLIDYYSRTTFFDLIKKSRSETVHSAFLAWILEGADFPNRGLSSNLMHFLQLLVSRKDNGQSESDFNEKLKDAICTGSLELDDVVIETEKPVQDFDSNANSKDRLDIYISCVTNLDKDKTLEIFIENKVGSKEGGPSDNKSGNVFDTLPQTKRYYKVCHDESSEKIQIFVYLTALSKTQLDDFRNLKVTDKCTCDKFIQICYQDILEKVLIPLKTIPNISSRSHNMIEEYISCLGIPAIEDEQSGNNNTSVKKQIIMAIPDEEREKLRTFFNVDGNKELIKMTLDVVALNKIYYSIDNSNEWVTITDVFKECLTKLLDKKEQLKIGNRPIIKKAGKKSTQYKNGEFYVEEYNLARPDVRSSLRKELKDRDYEIEEISTEIQSLLYSFWQKNSTLLLVALKVLSDEKGKGDNDYYEDCYNKLTSRDFSKFTIGDEEALGKTDVVERFVKHLIKYNMTPSSEPCEFINKEFENISKGPSQKGILINHVKYNELVQSEGEKKGKITDRYRKIYLENSEQPYYISTQWGGQYNSTAKTYNFPLVWKKIIKYNEDDHNKIKFNVKPTA